MFVTWWFEILCGKEKWCMKMFGDLVVAVAEWLWWKLDVVEECIRENFEGRSAAYMST